MSDAPRVKILLLMRRTARTSDKKRGGVFYLITENDLVAGGDPDEYPDNLRQCAYSRAKGLLGQARPGQVFEVEATTPTGDSVFTATARYRRMWPDGAVVTRWQAEEQVTTARLDLEDRAAKDRRHDAVLDCLAPLRKLYRRLPAPERAHLLALVVERLTRPL